MEKAGPTRVSAATPSRQETGSDVDRPNVVSPTPSTPQEYNSRDFFLGFDLICQLLDVSTENDIAAAVKDFFANTGCNTADDLVLFREQDFTNSTLSLMVQRKLYLISVFLSKNGSLREVDSMKDILLYIRSKACQDSARDVGEAKPNASNDLDTVIIDLNVGGHKFTTTRDTLCRVPGSLLEGMFSGRHDHPACRTEGGSYLIDRDGTHFQHILNFLRTGSVISLPISADSKEELAIEADYYGLDHMVRAIRVPQVDVNDHLSQEVLAMRNDENLLRSAFVEGKGGPSTFHRGLVPIFCPDNGVQPLPLRYEPVEDDHVLMGNLRKQPPQGTPVTAKSLEEFKSNFNREHPNLLHRLDRILQEERVIIAGGAVLRALTSCEGIRTSQWWGKKSDVDLFLYCQSCKEANRLAKRIWYALAADQEQWVIMRSHGVITMHNWVGERWTGRVDLKVQIVLRLYDSPAEVLVGFDVDCCCCAYDGESVWVSPRCMHALKTGVNILNPLHAWPNKASYELRLAKYAFRGFAVIVPGLDKKRVDYDQIRQSDLSELKGMARLLKIAFNMDTSPAPFSRFPESPREVKTLRSQVIDSLNGADLLIEGFAGYDDPITNVIVPTIYRLDGEPGVWGMMWYQYVGGGFPRAFDCRDEAWSDIVNGTVLVPQAQVPRRLRDSWNTEKRSREYLNAAMDKFDLDNIYYGHAYTVDAE